MARRAKKMEPTKKVAKKAARVFPKPVSDDGQIALMKRIVKNMKHTVGTVNDMLPDTIYPSVLTSLNRMLGAGGLPSRRFYLIHGENSTGKSVLAIAIGESFRRYGFVVKADDSEFGAEKEWYGALVQKMGFLFEMPEFMDDFFATTQDLFNAIAAEREVKKYAVNKGPGVCQIVDTINSLSPKSALEKVRKDGVKKAYSESAQWNDWLVKSFVPQVFHNNSALVVVTQHRENHNKSGPWDPDYKIPGGKAIQFGASIRFYVSGAKQVKEGDKVVGQQTFYVTAKNKSDGTSKQKGSFFTSNGRGGVPRGFDLVREAMEEATYRKQIKSRAKTDGRPSGNLVEVGEFSEFFPGGLADIREAFSADTDLFAGFVEALNADAERASYECAPPSRKKD